MPEEVKNKLASNLCNGCEVLKECATEAIDPPAIGTVRAGVWIPAGVNTNHNRRKQQDALRRLRSIVDA